MDLEDILGGFEKKKSHHNNSDNHNDHEYSQSPFGSHGNAQMPSFNMQGLRKFILPAFIVLGVFLVLIIAGGIFIGSLLLKGATNITSQAQKVVQQQTNNLVPSGIQDKQKQISDIYNGVKNLTGSNSN
jgi:hypothetical protein